MTNMKVILMLSINDVATLIRTKDLEYSNSFVRISVATSQDQRTKKTDNLTPHVQAIKPQRVFGFRQ